MVSRPSIAIGSIEAQRPSLPTPSTDASTITLNVAPAGLADATETPWLAERASRFSRLRSRRTAAPF